MSLNIKFLAEKSSIFFKNLHQALHTTRDTTQASILLQALHLHTIHQPTWEGNKRNTAQRKSDGKGQSLRFKLKLHCNITVTESLCTEHFCSRLPSQHPDYSPFHINPRREEILQPKLPNPHYKWGGMGNTSVFGRFLHHNRATSTFGKGGPSLLGHSQLKNPTSHYPIALCVSFSTVCCLDSFSIWLSKELEGKYLLWGSPLLLLWHKGSVQIVGFQELFSGLPLTLAFEVSCNETLHIR